MTIKLLGSVIQLLKSVSFNILPFHRHTFSFTAEALWTHVGSVCLLLCVCVLRVGWSKWLKYSRDKYWSPTMFNNWVINWLMIILFVRHALLGNLWESWDLCFDVTFGIDWLPRACPQYNGTPRWQGSPSAGLTEKKMLRTQPTTWCQSN